ncbi:MAG TPA: hypothetical protein VFI71_14580, partial [Pyrinomonadaceae bacterium]|nr:hypothetical protein [Pyrinomonadaceae bacterium]
MTRRLAFSRETLLTCCQARETLVDLFLQVVDAVTFGRGRFDDRRDPAVRAVRKRQDGQERSFHFLDTRAIAFVDHENVADFHNSGLQRL